MSARVLVGVQCFFATWCGFIVRIALSVLLLAMIYPSEALEARAELPNYGPRYNWSEVVQGHVLAAYFYGASVSPLVGGLLANAVGPRLVVGLGSLLAGLLTALCPLVADAGYGWLIAVRVITGLLTGTLYPALHKLVAHWAPPQEKEKFIWCLFGGSFGSVVTWPISTALTYQWGWMVAFYVLGGIVAVWSLVWFITVYDTPERHPRISDEELDYITTSIEGTISEEKSTLPFWAAITSGPFLALVILHFGNLGGLFFQLTEGPKYMMEVLNFDLHESGGYASIPHLTRLIFGIFFGILGDWCLYETSIRKSVIRKLFVIPSHIIPGALMILMGYVERNAVFAVTVLSLSLGFNGAATVTNLANHHDLSPNHAGALYCIMNTIGNCTGFIFPLIVGYLLQENKTEPPSNKSGSCLRRLFDAVPARLVVAVQCFVATWCNYMLRINLSLIVLAMVFPSRTEEAPGDLLHEDNATTSYLHPSLPDYGPRYNWSQLMQGHLLSAYFYGSVAAHIPGGMLAEVVGPRLVVGVTSLAGAVLTILCPLAAEAHIGWLIAARVLIGISGGPMYPSLHALVAQWGPPQEKSKFVWSLLGGTFGTVVTWPILSAIIESLGWKASFYIAGGVVAVWSVLWFLTVYDSPDRHPRITAEELNYITTSIAGTVSPEKRVLPFWSVITSCPFLALVVLHFGSLGGLFFLMTEGPKYMSEALEFDIKQSGGFASLPYLMRLLFGVVFSSVGDWILSKPFRNKIMVRKLFVIPSHFLPAALMASMGYVGKNEALAVAILSLSLGCNGAATVSNLSNHHDLAPNFAGSLYGIMNAIGTCTGFIFPAVVGYILEEGNTLEQWRIIFFIGSGLYLVSGLVFIFFGSAETQPWNYKKQEEATPS